MSRYQQQVANLRYNGRVGLAVACPITTQTKGYPFEIPVPPGLKVTGVVLADHVKSLDWRQRQAELMCTLPPETVRRVAQTLARLLPTLSDRIPP